MTLSLDQVIELACMSRYSIIDILNMDNVRQGQLYDLYVSSQNKESHYDKIKEAS